MTNPIKQIVEFNLKAGLLTEPVPEKEAAYQIEEALEGYDLSKVSSLLAPAAGTLSPKDLSRQLMSVVTWETTPTLQKVDQLDKALDHVVFGIGNAAKLGLSAQEITKALNIVMTANIAKIGCPLDSEGKLTKPDDWDEKYAPEPKLQAILDKIQA